MHSKKGIVVITSILYIFTNTIYLYPHQNLAGTSIFKLWQKKKIDPEVGLIIEARLRAIHKSIMERARDPETLKRVDEEITSKLTDNYKKFLRNYALHFEQIVSLENNAVFAIRANIYSDTHGEQQLVLFYNPDSPPWELLKEYGVKTPEDKEFAKRGWWITSIENHVDLTRRTFLALIALALPAALSNCVFDVSDLPIENADGGGIPTDAGHTTDGGDTPDSGMEEKDLIEQAIDAVIDNNNDPVTIVPTSTFTSEDSTQNLSTLSQFVRDNNSAFRYSGSNWQWELSGQDRINILTTGFTYIYNGRDHHIKLIGQDNTGRTKTIIFVPNVPGIANYNQPYRITITPAQIQQLAEQIELNLNTINILFENLAPAEDIIINGFQRSIYTVTTQSGIVSPIYTSTPYNSYSAPGVDSSISTTPEGTIILNYQQTTGDTGGYAGMEFSPYTVENLALQTAGGVATASSYYINPIPDPGEPEDRFAPWRAIDGIRGAINWYEWNANEEPPFWWQVDFPGPRDIHTVRIYDRANAENIINATLIFSDGSTIPIGEGTPYPINPAGEATIISFPEKPDITWIRVEVTASIGSHPGLSEFEALSNTMHNDLVLEGLTTFTINARGNSPFILQLTDNNGEELSVLVTGLDPVEFKGITIDLQDILDRTNPAFNLEDVQSIRIVVSDIIVPENNGLPYNGWVEIEGIYKPEPDTEFNFRLGYSTNDPDLEQGVYNTLKDNLNSITGKETLTTKNGIPVYGVKEWSLLSSDGLNFLVEDTTISAFTVYSPHGRPIAIYIPHPDLISIRLDSVIKDKVQNAIETRRRIIVAHEQDEISGITHDDAVLNEFTENINGLNKADVITILLKVLIDEKIEEIDDTFHLKFISALLMQGMSLTLNTYGVIIHQLLDPGLEIQDIYKRVIKELKGAVTTYITAKGFTHKPVVNIDISNLQDEPGFSKLQALLQDREFRQGLKQQNTIYVDLGQFFIENDSLSNAVTIDYEYLKRLVKFIRLIQGDPVLKQYIQVVGITDKAEDYILTQQLVSILRDHLEEGIFPIQYNVDFADYMVSGDAGHTVSILTQSSLNKIKNTSKLKIITPSLSGYNKVTTTGYEFYTALKGLTLSKEEFIDLVYSVAETILNGLVTQRQVTEEEKQRILDEIRTKGIGFIPAYFNPILYYKSIENQKALLIAA